MRLERLPPRLNVRRLDNPLLPPGDEVMARATLATGRDVQPARRRLTDGALAEGIAGGDRLPVAPLTDQAVLAAPTDGDHRKIGGRARHWPPRLLGHADQGDCRGGARQPPMGPRRQPAPTRLMERVARRNIRTGRPTGATAIGDPTVHLPCGWGSVRTAPPGPNAIGLSTVQRAGVPPRGATGVMGLHHRVLMVLEQVLRHPTQISKGGPVTAHKSHHATCNRALGLQGPRVAQGARTAIEPPGSTFRPESPQMAPVDLAWLARGGLNAHTGLVTRRPATRRHLGTQHRFLPVISPSTPLSVEDCTVVDAALKTVLPIRFDGVERADSGRPRRVAGWLRIRQGLTDGRSITADSLGNVGDPAPLTGERSEHEPFLHIDPGRPPRGTVSSASRSDHTLQRGECSTDVLGEYTTVSNSTVNIRKNSSIFMPNSGRRKVFLRQS
jgi:hypothetical protein